MKFRVALQHSEEGVSVSVPGLPGCWSQGADEDEALANIQVAIREYLQVADELTQGSETRVIEVAV
jgi:predicted RNase H-like HicB family nuclease